MLALIHVEHGNTVENPLKESLEEHGWAIAGSPPQWLRGHATFDGEMIRLDSSTAELYTPYSASELPYELSGIQRPTEAIEFVRKYGLLWHGPGASEFDEPYADWELAIGKLQTVIAIYESLRETRVGKGNAADRLRALFDKPAFSDEDILKQGAIVVAIWMSEGLEGVEVRLTPDAAWEGGDFSRFRYMARAETLLGYIYHHLSIVLVTRQPLAACLECMRFFVVRDPRQKYCNESCSYRSRYRNWKAKKERSHKEADGE